MLFLYDLPNWLLGVIVIAASVLVTFAVYFLARRVWRGELGEEQRATALAVLGIVATINSLLLAFSAVSVWESSGAASAAVVSEANAVSALARDLAIYDSTESKHARQMLRSYTRDVVAVEWHTMQVGLPSVEVWNAFDRMFKVIGTIEPDTPRRVALLPEILGRTDELLKLRRSRLYTSEAEVPGTLWSVVLLGSVVTVALAFVLTPSRFNLMMIGTLGGSLGLVFFLIVAMDRPFSGKESMSPSPFEVAIGNMERWDTVIAPGK